MRLEMGEARPKRLKKIRTTALKVRRHQNINSRGTKSKNTVGLGDLGLLLNVTEDGVLVQLGIEGADLALDSLLNLLNVGVGHKVLLNLLSLRGRHLEGEAAD